MAELSRGQKRAEVILRAKQAFQQGMSASSFISEMKEQGLSYRRTDMLADFRSVNELERKADAFRFVRKDYYPTERSMAQVEWSLEKEFMYKLKVQSQTEPGGEITERFVNITSDSPLTPQQVEEQAEEMIKRQSPKKQKEVIGITGWTALHRAI